MSRSEQLHDASMEEILASIRKIITDDEPEAPAEDAFSATAVDDFREASAALARTRPSGGYMHDLTRALAGDAPAASDDDIFDDAIARPALAILHPVPAAPDVEKVAATLPSPAVDDDADLFEAEPDTAAADAVLPEEAQPMDVDDDVIEELGDPIMLGPEIELVEEVTEASAPDEPKPEVEAPSLPGIEISASSAEISGAPLADLAVSPPVTAAPPPPPPPVVSVVTEEATADAAEDAATAPDALAASIAHVAANLVTDGASFDESPVAEAVGEAIAEFAVEAAAESVAPAMESVSQSVSEPIATAAEMSISEPVAETLEAKAAALIEEMTAPAAPDTEAPETEGAQPVPEAMASAPEGTPSPTEAMPSATGVVPDDMMAAMLKPMLKEWLDANMPRIVAKAMSEKDESGTPAE